MMLTSTHENMISGHSPNPGRNLTVPAVVLCSGYFLLQVAGYIYPTGFLWGVHNFGYLPLPYLAAAFALAAVGIWYCARGTIERPLGKIVRVMENRPLLSLIVLMGGLCSAAIFVRVSLPLLGDGYTVLNNIERTINGSHPLGPGNEPLSIGFFYGTASLLGARNAPGIADAFLFGEILLGCGFLVVTWHTVRELFPGKGDLRKAVAFCSLLVIPYIQLFLGYVEIYAVVLLSVAVVMLAVILYQNGKIPFYVLPPLFVLQFFVHYLGILFTPLVIHLAFREWRKSGGRRVAYGLLLSAVMIIGVTFLFGAGRLVPGITHSHILPFASPGDQYTAYTLFSSAHLLDVANILLFLAAGPAILIGLSFTGRWTPSQRPLLTSLIVAVGPPLLFVLLAKFDLGAAKDWDVPAPYFYTLGLFAAIWFLTPDPVRIRIMGIVLFATFVPMCAFVKVNSEDRAVIRRVTSLMDPVIMSQGGIYQTSFHLSMAYLERRQIDSMVGLWRRYVSTYPDDRRGYLKLAKSHWEYGDTSYRTILEVFENGLHRTHGDTVVSRQYADFSVTAGISSMNAGKYQEAYDRFRKSIDLNPGSPETYFQIGRLYTRTGEVLSARASYLQAIALAPSHVPSLRNIGAGYLAEGHPDSALPYLRRAVEANPRDVPAIEALGDAYRLLGRMEDAKTTYQQAARLGGERARKFLVEMGNSR